MGRLCGVLLLACVACKTPGSHAEPDAPPAVPTCGDGLINSDDEVCDDGNHAAGDGCSADCKSDETCGNGIIDEVSGETCDDGNSVGGDGCSADCKSDETCGNGVVDVFNGETCDDGNSTSGDGCSGTCQSNEKCGDGIKDPQEQCESSNQFTATCDPDCTFRVCGDGVKNAVGGEECDDGNTSNADACDAMCRNVVCGDNRVEGNEPCDDGNASNLDACLSNCTVARCGDTFIRTGVEQCDDGNTSNTDGCVGPTCQIAFCGDGYVRTGVEDCDEGPLNGSGSGHCKNMCNGIQP